jgi:polyisoprenoid-binding protein YceI
MSSYTLTPEHGTLSIRTGRAGAAAKAGHDLVMEVGWWEGTLTLADDPAASSVKLVADAGSVRVVDGSGGMTKLGDDDKDNIKQTIDDEVLKGNRVSYESTAVSSGSDGSLQVEGQLDLLGRREPLAFALTLEDGHLTATATVTQSAWGIKPYSALFGTLKVADDVVVAIDAQLPK